VKREVADPSLAIVDVDGGPAGDELHIGGHEEMPSQTVLPAPTHHDGRTADGVAGAGVMHAVHHGLGVGNDDPQPEPRLDWQGSSQVVDGENVESVSDLEVVDQRWVVLQKQLVVNEL